MPLVTPGDLPDPEIEPMSPASPTLAGRFFTTESPRKPLYRNHRYKKKKKDEGKGGRVGWKVRDKEEVLEGKRTKSFTYLLETTHFIPC